MTCSINDIACRGRLVKSLCLYHYRRSRYSKGDFRKFSLSEKAEIISLYKSGLSSQKVSDLVGCSRSAVSYLIHKNNLTRPRTQTHLLGKKMSETFRENQRKRLLGSSHSLETRAKMSASHLKRLEGYIRIEPEKQLIRKSFDYKIWRESVFKRDNYICQMCYKRGGILNADHIMPFALYPDLRFDLNNGRTLCVPCHKKTPTYAGKIHKYKMELVI